MRLWTIQLVKFLVVSYRCFIVVVFPIKLSLCKRLFRVRNCSNNMADKSSPRADNVVFCCSVVYSDNTGSNLAIKNGLYSFEQDYMWKDVLKELLDEKPTLPFCKADMVDVRVSSKLNCSEIFYPDMDEAIEVVKNFNIDLKYRIRSN